MADPRHHDGHPVSVKGVLLIAGRVLLLRNDRDEWELPGGRPDPRMLAALANVDRIQREMRRARMIELRVRDNAHGLVRLAARCGLITHSSREADEKVSIVKIRSSFGRTMVTSAVSGARSLVISLESATGCESR